MHQVEAKKGLFMAFEVKKEMKLAPVNRATLDGESRVTLDTLLETQVRTSIKIVLWLCFVRSL